MGSISVLEGSFPKQTATILDKSFILPKAVLTIKTKEKETRFYNLRAALKAVETIIDGPNPTIKIELVDGNIIIGKVDETGFTTLQVALAMGTDSESVIITPANKKAKADKAPSIWTEQYKVPAPIAVALIGFIILMMFLNSWDGSSPTSAKTPTSVHENTLKANAQVLCKDAVKAGLRSPSTADFPWTGDTISINGDQTEMVYESYVDAQNGFGATIRTNFTCTIRAVGGDKASLGNWKIQKLNTY